MSTTTDTPETDALLKQQRSPRFSDLQCYVAMTKLSRKLEHDLDSRTMERDIFMARIDELESRERLDTPPIASGCPASRLNAESDYNPAKDEQSPQRAI